MTNSFDRSHKDKKYFINGSTYNCPFCDRNHVKCSVSETGSYNASNTKTVYYYLVCCDDCGNISFHLSNYELITHKRGTAYGGGSNFAFPPQERKNIHSSDGKTIEYGRSVPILDEKGNPKELDDVFFYHQPSVSFTIDERIPTSIRKPLSEACDCLKSNFLTGASACLRKSIYKLLQHQKIPEKDKTGYDKRIDALKEKYSKIDSGLFDNLKAVHGLTSQEVHENDWQDFDAHTLRFLLEITKEVLIEIYVVPDEKQKRNIEFLTLKSRAKVVEQQ